MKKISNTDTKKLENLYKLNKIDELEQETKKLLAIDKNNAILLNILGVAYLKKKIFNKAEEIFKKILNHDSQDANALKNLGKTYKEINKIGYAIKYYEKYLAIKSNDSEIKNNLALCYIKNKKSKLALDLLKELIKKDSENQEYLINYSVALFESLSFNEAITILEKLLDKNLKNSNILSKYLFNQNYNADINFDKVNNYINKFYQSYNKENFKINSFCFNKKPEKINLGFVSPDFRSHPLGYAMINVIKNLKVHNFNLFAYYNFNIEDNLTNEFKKNFNYFKNISKLNDAQTVNEIRSDGIHILIDLAGYTLRNRLSIFLYNPAPIQISWLGYLPTTGIKEIKDGWVVITDKGEIACEHVVSCSGNFARQTGLMVGLEIPVIPVEHQYIVTEPHPEIQKRKKEGKPEMGVLRDSDYSWYMREEAGGLILGPYERGAPCCYIDGPST